MLSLRARVLLGAVLWTVGLVLLSFAIISHVFRVAPDLPFLGRRGSIHVIWASHAFLIVVTAAISLLGGAWQVRRGLSGISQLRTRLADVHGGRDARVEGRYVPEVQPLVDDLNALIEQREQAVQRAIAKAGDLAHGLKTPLALLAREAERAGASRPERARRGDRRAGRANAPADRLSPRARACRRVGLRAGSAIRRSGVGGGAGSDDASSVCGPPSLHRHACPCVGCRTRPAGGSRRDARQPARQRVQVGERTRGRRVGARW